MKTYKLEKIEVEFISLVKAGANGKQIIFKSASFSGDPKLSKHISIAKYDEIEGLVYGIVYAPDQVDSQGHFASAETIKKAAHSFMKARNTLNVDKDHDFKSQPAFVAESWLTKAGDTMFPEEPVGTWCVAIKLEDNALKEAVKSGEIAALSMAGTADLIAVEKEAKDFNSIFMAIDLWDVMDALRGSLHSIFEDGDVADKSAMVTAAFDQAKNLVLSRMAASAPAQNTQTEDTIVEKFFKALGRYGYKKAAPPTEPAPSADGPAEKPTDKGADQAELVQLIGDGFAEIKAMIEALSTRTDAVEKAAGVSKQDVSVTKHEDRVAYAKEIAALVNPKGGK